MPLLTHINGESCYNVTELGKVPTGSPTLTIRQRVGDILEIREPQHDLSCFASHVRISARLGKGAPSAPVASPGAGVFHNPMHPRAEALPLRLHQAVPPGPDQGLSRPLDPRPGVSLLDLDQHLLDRSGARAAPEPGRPLRRMPA